LRARCAVVPPNMAGLALLHTLTSTLCDVWIIRYHTVFGGFCCADRLPTFCAR
jgi:hypothetical protein